MKRILLLLLSVISINCSKDEMNSDDFNSCRVITALGQDDDGTWTVIYDYELIETWTTRPPFNEGDCV